MAHAVSRPDPAPRGPARGWLLIAALAVLTASGAGPAVAADLEPFFGAYVGVAEVEDLPSGATRQRDLDIVIQPYREGGFRIHWVNVTLVDGRRDRPGVQRRIQTVLFEPAPHGDYYFVEVQAENPFREREETRPMRGDPVRWATLDDDSLHVYSFVVLEDGRYELQTYDRVLTEIGLDILFERILDGEVVRRIRGSTARANVEADIDG
jgi:hypothetical protein